MCAKRVAKEDKWKNKSRFYKLPNGREVPSVTTVLGVISKPALVNWAAKMERELVMEVAGQLWEQTQAEKISKLSWISKLSEMLTRQKAHVRELEKALEIGSQAHSYIEWMIRSSLLHEVGPCPVIGEAAMYSVAAWQEWKNSVNFKPLLCEQPVWSETYGFAGTMDLLAEVDGVVTLLDWKTSKQLFKESWLQNIAYRRCVEEMGIGKPEKGVLIRLPKKEGDPSFEVQEVTGNQDELFEAFIHALELWKWQNKDVQYVQEVLSNGAVPQELAT